MRRLFVRLGHPLVPVVLLLVGAGAAALPWLLAADQYQDRVVISLLIALLTLVVLAGWVLACSGWRWWLRLLVIAPLILGPVCLRVDQVDADLHPRLTWRWAATGDKPPPEVVQKVDELVAPAQVACRRFLGDEGRATLAGWRLASDWQATPPRIRWQRPVGAAWSGCVVVDDAWWTMEQHGEQEVLSCYALADASLRWRHSWPARYDSTLGGLGPRATPTWHAGMICAVGATGVVVCCDAATGVERWRQQIVDAPELVPQWGVSSSPWVEGELVYVAGAGSDGASLFALDLASGAIRWRGGQGGATSYASPVIRTVAGVRQLLYTHEQRVGGYDPATGAELWLQPLKKRGSNVTWPEALADDRLFVSHGYGLGAGIWQLRRDAGRWSVESLWQGDVFRAKFSQFIVVDGLVYGLDDGRLACFDPLRRQLRWSAPERLGHGHLWRVGAHLLVTGEATGSLALVAIDPDAYRPLANMALVEDQFFNPPALAAPYLLVRDRERAICLQLPSP